MPKFIIQRWHGYHMVFAMCFCLGLIALLSTYEWIYGIVGLIGFAILALVLYRAEQTFRKDFTDYILTLTERVKSAAQTAMNDLPIGIILYDRLGKIEYINPFVERLSRTERLIGLPLIEVFPELKLPTEEVEKSVVQIQDRFYEVIHHEEERLYYLRDVTDLKKLETQIEDERAVLGFIHVDNYDEAGQGLSDQESTLLMSNVSGAISNWANEYDITLKKIESDKMFFVTHHSNLKRMMQSRFDILDVVREMTRQNKIPITLSIGVTSVGKSMIERAQNAQSALDIALARGGDQAAVQESERLIFFGGKTNAVEKRTRVRARVISHAMSNLFRDSERIIVMGHQHPDMDAIGAAIGVVKFAAINERKAYIVLDDGEHRSIERLLDAVREHETLGDVFISPEKALQWVDDPDTLLILVDTHRPSLAIEPRLLERAKRVVIIDHHRRGEDFVKDPVLVYLEPYASSTSELVTELLQYQERRLSMDTLEATALLAGIVVDTKNFAFRAGSRTFEAASFLRRHGADLMMVQSLLKEDLNQYIKRAELIKTAELIDGSLAIAAGAEDEEYDQVLIAQAADTLLNMQDVSASFAIGRREDGLVAISARSQGEINVQVIMEELGGGGHMTNAACQLANVSVEEAKQRLIQVLKEKLELGG